MTTYNVYQAQLSDQEIDLVNDNGWEVAKPYCDVTLAFKDIKFSAVLAARHYYTHNWVVSGDDVEDTFAATNMGGDSVVWRNTRAKSGSVGDVVIEEGSNRGWVCLGMGWKELDRNQVRTFETVVAQRAFA